MSSLPIPSDFSFQLLRTGDKGFAVRLCQAALVHHNYRVTVDGDFGKGTETAVKAFQTTQHLSADGVVGRQTWTALLADAPATPPAELSGAAWVDRFPTSKATDKLVQPFGARVDRFLAALRDAGVRVEISATFRPAQRAWLMHYAWEVASGSARPADVPALAGLAICWVHPTNAASIAAARAMVQAYNIAYKPSLTSRHTAGRAIDMSLSWTGKCAVTDASGKQVSVDAAQGTDNNTVLHKVGASYGVIKLVRDRPHWSEDGR